MYWIQMWVFSRRRQRVSEAKEATFAKARLGKGLLNNQIRVRDNPWSPTGRPSGILDPTHS